MPRVLATLKMPAPVPAVVSPGDVATDWLESLTAETRRAYGKDLEDFAGFLLALTADVDAWCKYGLAAEALPVFRKHSDRQAAAELLWSLTNGQANRLVIAYRTHMAHRKLSPATVRRRLSALRSIVGFARTIGRITWPLDVKSPEVVTYRDTAGPGEDGWNAMLAQACVAAELGSPRAGTAKGRRDLAMVRLMHDLLLRRGSVVSLDWPADVDLADGSVNVLAKGRTQRERKSLPAPTRDALASWIQSRGTWSGACFVRLDPGAGVKPGRLTGMAVWKIVYALGRQAGLSRATHPHALRHEGITEALAGGMTIEDVMELSGHRDPKTLMIYRDRIRDAAGDVARYLARK
jgi:integrase/recombinase XerC